MNPELVRVAGLLDRYDHGPGRRPDISLKGDDEDTADVIGEILDDDETAFDSEDGTGCHGGTALSRESPAAFLHDLILNGSGWLRTPKRSTRSPQGDPAGSRPCAEAIRCADGVFASDPGGACGVTARCSSNVQQPRRPWPI